jgi:phage terminase small subunit
MLNVDSKAKFIIACMTFSAWVNPKSASTDRLDAREQRFVDEYLIDLDPHRAALDAGYAETTARVKSYGWVSRSESTKPHVLAAILQAMAARSERTKIDADWVLTRLADEATADLAELYDDGGGLKPVAKWPLIWRQGLVAGLDVDEEIKDGEKLGQVTKLKLSDRIRRLEMIGKHVDVQAFSERKEIGGIGGGPVVVEDMSLREAVRRLLSMADLALQDPQ